MVDENPATHPPCDFRLSEANSTPLGTRRAFPNAPLGMRPEKNSTPGHGPNTGCPPSVAPPDDYEADSDGQSALMRDAIEFQSRLHFEKRMVHHEAVEKAALERRFNEIIGQNRYKEMTHVDPRKVFISWGGSGPGALIDPSDPDATNIYCESPYRDGPGNFSALVEFSQEGILGLAKFLLEQATQNKDLTTADIKFSLITEAQHSAQKEVLATAAEHVSKQLLCANCLSSIHRMRDCPQPDPTYGCILGCPLCNTKEHTLDECSTLRGWYAPGTKQTRFTQAGLRSFLGLILERENKPWFVSRLDPLEILGKVWASNPQTRPFLAPGKYPWTNEFSKGMARIGKGDPAMNGKVHWSDWSARTSKARDLPADPIFRDHNGRLLDPETVFRMIESKVIPSQATRNPNLDRGSN